ncbi:MAG: ribonuclease HI family protein [Gemmataceae bacterium]|nr:ribonuclease HI family protein [Gemmataceae bacterium]
MTDAAPWTIYTDGASRANPGPAAFAYVIERPGQGVVEENGCLGETTNNIAEYTALVRALEHAQRLGGRRLVINSDSELMVKQLNGEYRVKHAGLQPLFQQAKALARHFDNVVFRHIRREDNKRADQLCNQALDGVARGSGGAEPDRARPSRPKKPSVATRAAKAEAVRDQAVECLRSAAAAWARGNPNQPPPDAVWEQLWDILLQEGVLA